MCFSYVTLIVMFLARLTAGGSYTVTITLHSYSNLQHTCSVCIFFGRRGCCDDFRLRSSQCTGIFRCDTFFSFCLIPEGSSSSLNPPIRCSGPSTDTDIQSDSEETIDFPRGAVLGITNPFTLNGISNSWTGVQFQATVWDIDTQNADDIIDVVQLDINDSPGIPPQTVVRTGFFNVATLNFSYQVMCDERFYGHFCQHFNDCPSEDVCGLNGTCIDGLDSYSCQCDPGFTGENCDLEIPNFNHETVTRDIPCDPGYTGVQCTVNVDNCVGVSCSGWGQCMDGVNAFTCLCDLGFTGENCQININDCLETNCSGHGQCVDGVNSFRCECDPGYTGELCNSALVVTSECSSILCINGSCNLNENNKPVCRCNPGYTGERCHTNIDDCSGVDCGRNYHCVDKVNSYDCVCDFESTGSSCEHTNEGFDTSNAVPEDEESTSPLEEETEKEVKLPLVVGGAMGGVILLLLLLAIVLMTVALVYCHAARKSAKNRGNDLRCTSNHPVGFNAMVQSVEPSEVFNMSANVGYGALRAHGRKESCPERSDYEEGYENDGFTHHIYV